MIQFLFPAAVFQSHTKPASAFHCPIFLAIITYVACQPFQDQVPNSLLGGEGRVGHQPDVHKRIFLAVFVCFGVSIGVRHPAPPDTPSTGVRITIYLAFWTFLRAIGSRRFWMGRGVSSKRMMLDRGGGPSSMDDP